jgi:hypothetical protein
MQSPAAAFAWEFRHRHRWFLIAVAVYLLVLALAKALLLGADQVLSFDPPDGFAAFAVVPFNVTFFYLISVFTFGTAGDVAARQSIYPSRLFTLPVSTAALAGWPMLYGTLAMFALWLVAMLFARWQGGFEFPFWPGALTAVVLAWLQVFMWMPYGLRGLRVIMAVVVMTSLNTVVLLAIELKWSDAALIAFLLPQLPIAYLAACIVTARARRGHVPDWSLTRARAGAGAVRVLRPFRSVAAAQLWFEWRRHGRSLPGMVALVVPFELSVLFISGYESQWFVFEVLMFLLLTPILMAAFAGATVSKANPFARDVYGLSPFHATKPMTSAAMIAAKLTVAVWSTLAAWSVLLVAMAVGFTWSGADSVVFDWADRFVGQVGLARAIVAALIALGGLISLSWTMLVQGLFISLTGRLWLVRTIGMATLVAIMAIGPVFEWITDSTAALRWLWDNWTIVPAILVVLKIAIAIVVAQRLSGSGLISDRVLAACAALWVASVFGLYGVIVWWVDTPMLPRYLFLMIAILAVPLVRISAAPLALDWNRHR